MRNITIPFLSAALLSLVFGCSALKTSQQDQNLLLPSTYEAVTPDTSANMALLSWQAFFEDPKLQQLIQTALQYNQDNLITLERIRIAQANYRIARVGFLPEVNAFAGASRRKFGDYTMDGVGNADTNLSPSVPEDKRIPDPYRDFITGAEFSWELDVWGKFRNRKKAASARLMASQEIASLVKTKLISEVAGSYFKLMGLDEELHILEENIALQELAFKLTIDLKAAGKENQLAVDQFEALLLNSKALLIQKQRQLKSEELYMSTLLGRYDWEHPRSQLSAALNQFSAIQVGLPAAMLQFRPDIRMAERELVAAKADVNSARAAFFPSLNLYGMAGFNAFDFGKLFFNPASVFWQLGSGLSAPVFNRGAIRAAYQTAESSQKIAWTNYEQVVFRSYVEVLDLVNQLQTFEQQLKFKTQEVNVQKRSVDNSNTMFSVGYANYLEVLNAQSRALQAEIERIELQTLQLQTKVHLYRALGGGWL